MSEKEPFIVWMTTGEGPAILHRDQVLQCCRAAFEHGEDVTDEEVLEDALEKGVVRMVEVEGMEEDDE